MFIVTLGYLGTAELVNTVVGSSGQYNYVTFQQVKDALAARLLVSATDPTQELWTDEERGLLIIEALRTWNSLTGFFRSEFLLDTIPDQTWYDITNTDDCPNTTRPYTVTDTDLYTQMEYHLMEPPTGGVWTGSLQFNIYDLQNAVQRKRNEVISITGCVITRRGLAANPGRITLPDTLIDIRRVAWIPLPDLGYEAVPLYPEDEFGLGAYEPDFAQETGEPSTYQQSSEPPLAFDVNVTPVVPGQYEVLSVDAGVPLAAPIDTVLTIPDDFTWVVKFGAMSDLLNQEGNAKDELRAKYCDLRYRMGVALLRAAPAILVARIQNVPLDIESAQSIDNYRPGWQGEEAGQPDTLVIAGVNLIGFAPTPDEGPYSATLSVVRNAPLPTTDPNKIQLGQDDYDSILDYAQHLGALKLGGAEFAATMPLLQKFLNRAALSNSKLANLGEYQRIMAEMSQLQAEFNPVYSGELDPINAQGDNNG